MLTEKENLWGSWEDALDDGSLTLAAELLIVSLPSEIRPAYTCVHHPSIINTVANLDSNHSLDLTNTRRCIETFTSVQLHQSVSDIREFRIIEKELLGLSHWLLSKQPAKLAV